MATVSIFNVFGFAIVTLFIMAIISWIVATLQGIDGDNATSCGVIFFLLAFLLLFIMMGLGLAVYGIPGA